jgi:hypothetical protein
VARDFEDIERDFGGAAVREALDGAQYVGPGFAPLGRAGGGQAIVHGRSRSSGAIRRPSRGASSSTASSCAAARSAPSSLRARRARRRSRSAARSAWRPGKDMLGHRVWNGPHRVLAVEPRGRSRGGREDRPRLPQAVGSDAADLGDRLFINGADSIGSAGSSSRSRTTSAASSCSAGLRSADRGAEASSRSTISTSTRSSLQPRGRREQQPGDRRGGQGMAAHRPRGGLRDRAGAPPAEDDGRRVHRAGCPRRRRDDQCRPLVPGAAAHEQDDREEASASRSATASASSRSTTTRTTRRRPRSRPSGTRVRHGRRLGNADVGRRARRTSIGAMQRWSPPDVFGGVTTRQLGHLRRKGPGSMRSLVSSAQDDRHPLADRKRQGRPDRQTSGLCEEHALAGQMDDPLIAPGRASRDQAADHPADDHRQARCPAHNRPPCCSALEGRPQRWLHRQPIDERRLARRNSPAVRGADARLRLRQGLRD